MVFITGQLPVYGVGAAICANGDRIAPCITFAEPVLEGTVFTLSRADQLLGRAVIHKTGLGGRCGIGGVSFADGNGEAAFVIIVVGRGSLIVNGVFACFGKVGHAAVGTVFRGAVGKGNLRTVHGGCRRGHLGGQRCAGIGQRIFLGHAHVRKGRVFDGVGILACACKVALTRYRKPIVVGVDKAFLVPGNLVVGALGKSSDGGKVYRHTGNLCAAAIGAGDGRPNMNVRGTDACPIDRDGRCAFLVQIIRIGHLVPHFCGARIGALHRGGGIFPRRAVLIFYRRTGGQTFNVDSMGLSVIGAGITLHRIAAKRTAGNLEVSADRRICHGEGDRRRARNDIIFVADGVLRHRSSGFLRDIRCDLAACVSGGHTFIPHKGNGGAVTAAFVTGFDDRRIPGSAVAVVVPQCLAVRLLADAADSRIGAGGGRAALGGVIATFGLAAAGPGAGAAVGGVIGNPAPLVIVGFAVGIFHAAHGTERVRNAGGFPAAVIAPGRVTKGCGEGIAGVADFFCFRADGNTAPVPAVSAQLKIHGKRRRYTGIAVVRIHDAVRNTVVVGRQHCDGVQQRTAVPVMILGFAMARNRKRIDGHVIKHPCIGHVYRAC